MFVTLVIGILVLIVSGPVGAARERAMVAATKTDMKNLQGAIERYVAREMKWPTSLDDLDDEYEQTADVLYCTFTVTPGADLPSGTVSMSAMHRGSLTVVSTVFPTAQGQLTETALKNTACSSPIRKGSRGKSSKK
jgi:Tfp pilus assembly protein PilE